MHPSALRSIKQVFTSTLSNHCMFCLEPSRQTICDLCLNSLPRLSVQCPKCAEPNHHGEVCGHCLKQPPLFDQVICPYLYQGPVQNLVVSFKAKTKPVGVNHLVEALSEQLGDFSFDYITPIPYHWKRLLWRGHNPVRELAYQLSKRLSTPMIDGLLHHPSQYRQKQLKREQRLFNLMGAFSINERALLKRSLNFVGKNILLVDDVLTTGATCNSAAMTLKQAGAKSVSIACLARTPSQH